MATSDETWLSPATAAFLSSLKANNSRDWFEANRPRYEAALRAPAKRFASALATELERRTGVVQEPRIYRINRDLRFARDKTPYNAHLHIGFSAGPGGRGEQPAWMFGLEPDGLAVGTGIFAFTGAALADWRSRVAGPDGAALAAVIAALGKGGIRIDPPELKRVPAPYPPDHPHAGLLRRKGLTAWIDGLPQETAYGPDGPQRCADTLLRLRPLHDWLHRA